MRLLHIGLEICLLELQCCIHVYMQHDSPFPLLLHTITRARTPNTGPSIFPLSALLQSLMCSVEHPLSVFALRLAAQETRSRQVHPDKWVEPWNGVRPMHSQPLFQHFRSEVETQNGVN